MKYGRPVDHGDTTRLIDVVEIPHPLPFGETPEGFLRIMFPQFDDFVQVPESAKASDVVVAADLGDPASFRDGKEYRTEKAVEAAAVEAANIDEIHAA